MKIKRIYLLALLSLAVTFFNFFFTKAVFINFDSIFLGDFNEDGFNSQLIYSIKFVLDGFDLSLYGGAAYLAWLHMVRLLIAMPFYGVDEFFGVAGQMLLMDLIILYAAYRVREFSDILYFSPVFIFPLFISWRSVLVMLVVPLFLAFFLSSKRRRLDGFLAIIFACLSSAALVYIILAAFLLHKEKYINFSERSGWVVLMPTTGAFMVALFTKVQGFVTGDDGYNVEGVDNPFLALLLRSTFIVKLYGEAFDRQLMYMLLLVFVMIAIFYVCFKDKKLIDKFFLISLVGLS